MPGIQTRGSNRITTNKIEQDKKIVEVYKSGQSTPEHHTNAVAVYQPLPSSSKLEQSTQNQIQSTESNIEQAVRAKKVKHMVKPRTSDDPASKIMLGMSNTIQDYGGIVQGGYEDKSILNQAIGHAFEGNWDKAGQVIQENPYRFAGNLAVEAGTFLIPVGAVLKVAKVGKLVNKIPFMRGKLTNYEKIQKSYPESTSNKYPGLEKKINDMTPEQFKKIDNMLGTVNPEQAKIQSSFIKAAEHPKASSMEASAVTNRLIAAEKVSPKPFWNAPQALLAHATKNLLADEFKKHFGKTLSPSGNKILMKSIKEEVLTSNWGKGSPGSDFERTQMVRGVLTGKNFGVTKDGLFRTPMPTRSGYNYSGQQSYDREMAKKLTGIGLGIGTVGTIGWTGGLSTSETKDKKDKSFGGFGQFL